MRKKSILLILSFLIFCSFIYSQKVKNYDVVIYGGTSAGITAAIQASRMNKSVVLIEPTNRLGGLTAGGLGATDVGNSRAVGGIAKEFYMNVANYYLQPENWKWQKLEDYRSQPKEGSPMFYFEPSVALSIYKEMLSKEKVDIVLQARLDRNDGVKKEGAKIVQIRMVNGLRLQGKIFIDATYEGDLMAAAGVSYVVGRESNKEYGESSNGVQTNNFGRTLNKTLSNNGINHNFVDAVDPYIEKGNSRSGLLPYISEKAPGIEGYGDNKIQAYCFRMTLTDHPENKIPFKKPNNYNELNFELLFRNYEADWDKEKKRLPWINTHMPNRKTDTNNSRGFSTDFIGQNYDYPEASYEEREKIIQAHKDYQQGLMWTLANHPRVPIEIREEVSKWGTCKDEYELNNDGWTPQLYIREARRMKSDFVMTQKHCELVSKITNPIGMGAYTMDSHNVQRYVDVNGYVKNEGNVEARLAKPYPISYSCIVPKKGECENLLVPVCLSATHIAFGSIRMEPVFMILGQSAATAAIIAIDQNISVQNIDYHMLKNRLEADGQILK